MHKDDSGCFPSCMDQNDEPIIHEYQLKKQITDSTTYFNKVTCVFGLRGVGKTMYVKNEIYYNLQNVIEKVYVVCPPRVNDEYTKITNNIYDETDLSMVCEQIMKERTKCLLILDGIPVDSRLCNNTYFRKILYDHRWYNCSVVMSVAYIERSCIYDLIDICIACTNVDGIMKQLYSKIFGMTTFSVFAEIMQQMTHYKFLVRDEGKIYWNIATIKQDDELKYLECVKQNYVSHETINKQQHNKLIDRLTACIDEMVSIRNELKYSNIAI